MVKRSIFILFTSIFLLGACAKSPIAPGLNALKGENIRTAVSYLGYPDSTQEVLGDTVYIWEHKGTSTDVYPITDYDTSDFEVNGQRGRIENRNTSYVSEVYSYSCVIKMAIDERDIIKDARAQSTGGGCRLYNSAFQRIVEDYNIPLE